MQPIRAETLFRPGLKFPADGGNLKIDHVYNDGHADLLTKLWLKPPDDPRGKLVICPRCSGACRLLVGAPNNRGLCCTGCLSRLKHIQEQRESWGSSRKRVEKVEISTDKPANKTGSGSKDRPLKKISTTKKGQSPVEISTPGNKSFSKKEKNFPELPATRLHSSATNKKGKPTPKRRRQTAQKPIRKAA